MVWSEQVNRRSDIYVFSSSFTHSVVPKDKWLAFVSTTVETSNPEAELAPGTVSYMLTTERTKRRSEYVFPIASPGACQHNSQDIIAQYQHSTIAAHTVKNIMANVCCRFGIVGAH